MFKSTKFLQVHLFEMKDVPREEHARTERAEIKAKESDEFDCKICGKKLDDLDQFRLVGFASFNDQSSPFIFERLIE